eukprot:1467563-Pyramimonas_sp.AAC.2
MRAPRRWPGGPPRAHCPSTPPSLHCCDGRSPRQTLRRWWGAWGTRTASARPEGPTRSTAPSCAGTRLRNWVPLVAASDPTAVAA